MLARQPVVRPPETVVVEEEKLAVVVPTITGIGSSFPKKPLPVLPRTGSAKGGPPPPLPPDRPSSPGTKTE